MSIRHLLTVWFAACVPVWLAAATAAGHAVLVTEGWRRQVWAVYPVEKVKADEVLPLQPRAARVELTAARGETEPFVLVLRCESPLRQIEVTCGPLRTADQAVLEAAAVTVRRLGYIHIDAPSGTGMRHPMPYPTGTGDFPDPVLAGPGDARPGRNLQFLVTVAVPRDAKPGRYEGALSLRFRREGWMAPDKAGPDTVPLGVTVRSFALPAVLPLLNTAVASPHALPAWLNRPETRAGLRRMIVAYHHAPDPLPPPEVRVEPNGALRIDTAEWEAAAAELLETGRAPHLFVPVWSGLREAPMQGVYFLWHFPAVTRQRWFGAPICGEQGDLTPEFKRLFGAYLRHMHALLVRRGWLNRMFITTMDEPYTYHLHNEDRPRDTPENNYRVIANYVRFVRATAPGLRTFATADPVPGLTGLIDHWCLRNLKHAAEARQRAEAHGECVTFCDNYRTFIDYPAVSARSLGWLAWKLGACGWLTYETLGSFTRAWEGPAFAYPLFSGGLVWGMGHLFYPDTEGAGGIAPSLRWELMREGCEDYAYLWLLRERLAALPPERRATAAAREARRLLDTAAAQVVGGAGDAETASGSLLPNAHSQLVPHDLRRRIGDLIESELDRPVIRPDGTSRPDATPPTRTHAP